MTTFDTRHDLCVGDATQMSAVPDASVQLVLTSPPYPMIEMWDASFSAQSAAAAQALAEARGPAAFEAMHQVLDQVWAECARVLSPGGIACVNIGDATRTLGGQFQLYANHARILTACAGLGLVSLPDILWRKPTNAPNKFMGSGMLPGGAYVTYEHEYILILRKGGRRVFRSAEAKANRRRSAYFWEERNVWFSDVWTDLRGVSQRMGRADARDRSGAFPLALAYRLISMYSVYQDTVLDPFVGTGTTSVAAAISGRNSVGVEREPGLVDRVRGAMAEVVALGEAWIDARLEAHSDFVRARVAAGKALKHHNTPHNVAVITGQERELQLLRPQSIAEAGAMSWRVVHAPERPSRPSASPTQLSLIR